MKDVLEERIRRLAVELGDAAPPAPDWNAVTTSVVPAQRPAWLVPVTALVVAAGVTAFALAATRTTPGPTEPTVAPPISEVSVAPTSAASTTTVPSSTSPPSAQAAIDISSLSRALMDVHDRLQPSIAATIGWNIALNGGNTAQLTACMAERGVAYRGSRMEFVVTGPRPRTEPDRLWVDPAWHVEPDPELARRGGVGFATGVVPSDPILDMVPVSGVADSLPAEEQEGYDEAFGACERALSSAPDARIATMLDNEMFAIGRLTTELPGFAAIEEEYHVCVRDRGLEIDDPANIWTSLFETDFGPEVDIAELERSLAVADAECRAPLWERFIELDASTWRDWLDRNADRIAAAEAQQSEYEAIALAAWVPGSEGSVPQITSAATG